MTKKQLKEKYINWCKAICECEDEKDLIFQQLQDLCFEVSGKRSCSLEECFKETMGSEKEGIAFTLYEKYLQIEGAFDALARFSDDTNAFSI